ncbi:MAG TPA: fibronectin type III domain-containing protein [Candidatus Lokiarchaeia archaeon]|nr:fibronectin type III domain-containing protein [Candidatus Lokiarchaeia archaeon]
MEPINASSVESPVYFLAHATGGDWPVMNIVLFNSSSVCLANLTIVNGTAMDGFYNGSVDLPSGFQSIGIKIYDTQGNSELQSVFFNVTNTITENLPWAPQALRAMPGNNSVVLTWAAPASNGGSAITGYQVFTGTTPSGETWLSNVTATTYTITGLTNDQVYYFKVAAMNIVGVGANSTEANATPSTASQNHLPILTLVFFLNDLTFSNPVLLTVNITFGDFPVQRAWCIVDQSSQHVLTRINGTALSAFYSTSVNLTSGSHVLTFFVNDTQGNTISKTITITVIPVASPSTTETATFVIITVIIGGMSLGIAVPVSYNRYKSRVNHGKSTKSRARAYTQLTGDESLEMTQGADAKRSRLLNASMPIASTEQRDLGVEVAKRCVVHKGLIAGPTYRCKHCGAFYCAACVKQLMETQEPCWSCFNAMTMDDISLVNPTTNDFTRDNGRLSLNIFRPVVIQKIHDLGIKDDVIPDVLELLKNVPQEHQMQFLENIDKENEDEEEAGKDA